MALFGFGRPRRETEARSRVEAWAREICAGDPRFGPGETVVKANEIVCADPRCPGVETVVLVLGAGRRSLAFKIVKPLAEIAKVDLEQAMAPSSDADGADIA